MFKTFQKRNCLLCGKDYKTKTWNQKYCCKKCQKKANPSIYHEERWKIFNRDDFTCQYCGRNPTEDKVKLHIDHINPKKNYGTDEKDNLVTACGQCNTEKGAHLLINETLFKNRMKPKYK